MKRMYLSCFTRPDILFADKASNPTQLRNGAFLRIILYLKRKGNISSVFRGDMLKIQIHCDASPGVHNDGKQKTVSLHSTDAATIAVVKYPNV